MTTTKRRGRTETELTPTPRGEKRGVSRLSAPRGSQASGAGQLPDAIQAKERQVRVPERPQDHVGGDDPASRHLADEGLVGSVRLCE